jgi:hypothetical protein
MTVLPALRANVLAAATRRAEAAAPARLRRRRRLRAGLLAVGAVVATGSALAATGAWNPQVGDDRRGHPTISGSAVPDDQLAHFGVLRRPATDADHGPKVQYALRYLDARSFAGVRTDSVRLLSTAGRGYVLIPTEEATLGGAAAAAGAPRDDALCLFAIDKDGGGLSCWSTEQILAGRAILISATLAPLSAAERAAIQRASKEAHGKAFAVPGVRPRTTGETFAGLVPDGVAAVEIGIGTGPARVSVADNFFVAHIDIDPDGPAIGTPLVRWFDAAGRDITPGR